MNTTIQPRNLPKARRNSFFLLVFFMTASNILLAQELALVAYAPVNENIVKSPSVYVVKSFTPDGDGNYDAFKVYGNGIRNIDFKVYHKTNGELLYQTQFVGTATTKGWDGTSNGKTVEAGNYTYAITGWMDNGKQFILVGEVALMKGE